MIFISFIVIVFVIVLFLLLWLPACPQDPVGQHEEEEEEVVVGETGPLPQHRQRNQPP